MNEPEKNEPSVFIPKNGKKPKVPLATKIVAKVMAESGFTHRETAKELNISRDTLEKALRDTTLDRDLIEKAKSQLPNKLYLVAFKLADKLQQHPEFLDKMNPYMCALVMGIMIDKARLMDGQSTENIAVKGTVAEIQTTLQTIAEMRQRLEQMPSTPASPEE